MADVLHNTLTAADLHEPKGASTATQGQVYVADGNGSGVWTSISFTTPPGMIAPFMTPVAPFGWLELNGAVLNINTYASLYNALTISLTGTRVNGQAIITGISNTVNLREGYYAFGVGIAAGTKILSVDSSSQITLDDEASSTGTAEIVFSPWALGLNTITLPDLTAKGYYIRSRSLNKNSGYLEDDDVKPHKHPATATTSITSAGAHTHAATVNDPGHYHTLFRSGGSAGIAVSQGPNSFATPLVLASTNVAYTGISISNASAGDHSHASTTTVMVNDSTGAETRPASLSAIYCVKT